MKSIVFILSLLMCSMSLALEPEQIRNIVPSAIQIEAHDNGMFLGGGSGICIYAGTQQALNNDFPPKYIYVFSTAAHVLHGGPSKELYAVRVFEYDERCKRLSEQVLFNDNINAAMEFYYDTKTDAAFLVLHTQHSLPVSPVPMCHESALANIAVGDRIMLLGSPLLVAPIFSEGYIAQLDISSVCNNDILPWMVDLISVNGDHGDSGGGIFNKDGELIGTLSLGFSRDSHGFALGMVNLRHLYALMRTTVWHMTFAHLMTEEECVNDNDTEEYPIIEDEPQDTHIGTIIKPLE